MLRSLPLAGFRFILLPREARPLPFIEDVFDEVLAEELVDIGGIRKIKKMLPCDVLDVVSGMLLRKYLGTIVSSHLPLMLPYRHAKNGPFWSFHNRLTILPSWSCCAHPLASIDWGTNRPIALRRRCLELYPLSLVRLYACMTICNRDAYQVCNCYKCAGRLWGKPQTYIASDSRPAVSFLWGWSGTLESLDSAIQKSSMGLFVFCMFVSIHLSEALFLPFNSSTLQLPSQDTVLETANLNTAPAQGNHPWPPPPYQRYIGNGLAINIMAYGDSLPKKYSSSILSALLAIQRIIQVAGEPGDVLEEITTVGEIKGGVYTEVGFYSLYPPAGIRRSQAADVIHKVWLLVIEYLPPDEITQSTILFEGSDLALFRFSFRVIWWFVCCSMTTSLEVWASRVPNRVVREYGGFLHQFLLALIQDESLGSRKHYACRLECLHLIKTPSPCFPEAHSWILPLYGLHAQSFWNILHDLVSPNKSRTRFLTIGRGHFFFGQEEQINLCPDQRMKTAGFGKKIAYTSLSPTSIVSKSSPSFLPSS